MYSHEPYIIIIVIMRIRKMCVEGNGYNGVVFIWHCYVDAGIMLLPCVANTQ